MPFLLLFIPLVVVPVMLLYLLSKEILTPLISVNARNIKFLKHSIRAHNRRVERARERRRGRKPRTSIQSETDVENMEPLPQLRLDSATFVVKVTNVDAHCIAFERDSLFQEYRLRGSVTHGITNRAVLTAIDKGTIFRLKLHPTSGELPDSSSIDLKVEGDGVILGLLDARGRATLSSGFNARAFGW